MSTAHALLATFDAAARGVTALFQLIADFANSSFFIALVTAFAGAAAGAVGAQLIINRNAEQSRLRQEIQATNSAIMVTFEIFNTFCGLKSQHIMDMKAKYDEKKKELDEKVARSRRDARGEPETFEFEADFRSLNFPRTPSDVLQALMFEKITLVGRPLSALTRLLMCLDSLAAALRERNEFIAHTKIHPLERRALLALYFGKPTADGREDLTYPSCMEAIYLYTNNVIFFAKVLIEDLSQHGRSLAVEYGSNAPKVHRPDFSIAGQKNLIPPDEEFADWWQATKGTTPSPARE